MYRLGDVFQIPLLCKYAVAEFLRRTYKVEWTQPLLDDFCEAIKLIYRTTLDSDRGMREAVRDVAMDHCRSLLGREQFMKVLREEIPELGADLLAGLNQSDRIKPGRGT